MGPKSCPHSIRNRDGNLRSPTWCVLYPKEIRYRRWSIILSTSNHANYLHFIFQSRFRAHTVGHAIRTVSLKGEIFCYSFRVYFRMGVIFYRNEIFWTSSESFRFGGTVLIFRFLLYSSITIQYVLRYRNERKKFSGNPRTTYEMSKYVIVTWIDRRYSFYVIPQILLDELPAYRTQASRSTFM